MGFWFFLADQSVFFIGGVLGWVKFFRAQSLAAKNY
jgi:hypothetical protein